MKKQTALIIGGGFAGLSAAVFLDGFGFQITLLEKKPILGGRAYAFFDKKTDTWVDNGQHLMMGAYHETRSFIENIGVTRHLGFQEKTHVPLISDKNKITPFILPNWKPPFNLLCGLLRTKALGTRDKMALIRNGQKLLRLKNDLRDDNSLEKTVDAWLTDLGQSERAKKNFWDILTLATLNDDPKVAGARGLAAVLAKGFLTTTDDAKLILPKSNLNDLLSNPARTYLEMRGHTIQTGTGVKIIHVLDDRIQSVELESGEHLKADVYLSSVPFRELLRLIPQGFVDKYSYFSNLKQLKSAPIVSINLWFDRDILPHDFVGLADTTVHWFFNKNRIYGKQNPPYHYMGVVSGAYGLLDASRDEILKIALDELAGHFPKTREAKLLHSLVNKEREATLSPQVGSEKFRPAQQSPFSNFYVTGDWTNTGLPATIESAVLSARLAVEHITSSCQTHPQYSPPAAR